MDERSVGKKVWGLPANLVNLKDGHVPIISMMQQFGLNRELKRDLAATIKLDLLIPKTTGMQDADRKVLSLYINPYHRFFGFWNAVREAKKNQGRIAPRKIFRAPDFPLLFNYSADFLDASFDKEAVKLICPVWDEIELHVVEELQRLKGDDKKEIHASLGAFMVWTSVVTDLAKWDLLDPQSRLAVENAIFALTSISLSDWFIHDAIRRCPSLNECFIPLLKTNEDCADLADGGVREVADQSKGKSIELTPDDVDSDWHGQWAELSGRLSILAEQVGLGGSQRILKELEDLNREFQALGSSLPADMEDLYGLFETRLQELIVSIHKAQADAEFSWLDDFVINQIGARWRLDRQRLESEGGLKSLVDDIARAMEAGSEKINDYRASHRDLVAILDDIRQIDKELGESATSITRRTLQFKRTEKKKDEVRLESLLQTIETEILSAYSPHGEVFDYMADYFSQVNAMEECFKDKPQGTDSAPNTAASDCIKPVEPIPVVGEPIEPVLTTLAGDDATDAGELLGEQTVAEPPLKAVNNDVSSPSREIGSEPTPTDDTYGIRDGDVEENLFSPEAGELCRPLWTALQNRRLSLAYHAARALEQSKSSPKVPSSNLLAALCLANELVLPDGAIAQALEGLYPKLSEDDFGADAPHSWQVAQNLLLAAATMKPLLLSPGSGAAAVSHYLHLDAAHQGVYRLMQMLLKFGERLQGFHIEEATFKQAKTQAAWQREFDFLKRDAQEWLEQAPHMSMLFAAAGKVWHQWQRPGGVVSDLLTPVVSNDLRRIDEVKRKVKELAVTEGIHRQVQHTDRVALGRRKGEDIHSRALAQIVSRVDEAVSLARRWIVLTESRPRDADVLSERLAELRDEFLPLRGQVATDLSSAVKHDDWGLIASARAAVRRSLSSLAELIDPEIPGKAVEKPPEQLLGIDLLLVPNIDLDATWAPNEEPAYLLESISNAMQRGLDAKFAFEERIRRHDLYGSEQICRLAESGGDLELASQLDERWHKELEEHVGMLRRQLDSVRSEIEDGLSYGFITESERTEFDGRLVQYESKLDSLRHFDEPFIDLTNISNTIQSGRKSKIDVLQTRVDQLKRDGAEQKSIDTVQTAIDQGDVLTANEFLQRIEHHESIEPNPAQVPDRFNSFFPSLANSIDLELQQNFAQLRHAVREAGAFGGLDYGQLAHEAPIRQSASDMVGIWLDMKARKRVERDSVFRFLQAIGFGVLNVQMGPSIGTRVECELLTEPIEDRSICPIPYFGSHANGRYRVLCIWQRPAEDEIVKLAGDSTITKPTLVLYFGRLSERKRREASKLAKQNHRSFLLVDETLLIFLTAEPRSRLAALFEVALPFSYSAPYDATSSVVPSEMFFGRALELQAIQGQNGRCFIYGGRQLGKTALLRKVERTFHAPNDRRFAKWIDLRAEGIGVNKAPSEIWVSIAREFRQIGAIPEDFAEPNPNVKGRVEAFISQLKQYLGANANRRILLLLDEADRFFDQDGRTGFQETARLKGLMEDTERRFKVVFAGLHNVLRMTERANHPLAHLGEPINVGPLLEGQEWRDAEELIRKPFEAAGFEFESRSLITRILAHTNYYPSLIQLYCTHLLRQMLGSIQRDARILGPRYQITAKHVDAAYRSRALRDEIRTKFQLTLQLDPRYEVIAYTLAYGALDGWCSLTEGIQTRDIKEKAARWWPEGFGSTGDLEFRVLLDEMVGLGVLRQPREGRFTLRNPNVLLLLGTHDEIEDVLIKEREQPQEFESSTFRSRFQKDLSSTKRNPLTFDQLSNLQRRRNGVTVVTGCKAAGIDDLIPFLETSIDAKYLSIFDGTADRGSFMRQLDKLNDRAADGTTIMVVSADSPWNFNWVSEASHKISGLSSKDRFAHVLFLADAATTWQVINEAGTTIPDQVSSLNLQPWHDAFVRQWLEDCQLPNDPVNRKNVVLATGNWPSLLYMLVPTVREGSQLHDRLSTFNSKICEAASRPEILKAFGLDIPDPREIVSLLATLGEEARETDLASLGETDLNRVQLVMKWAELLGVARRSGAESWNLDPIVQRILTS
jgi:hypothetical protein